VLPVKIDAPSRHREGRSLLGMPVHRAALNMVVETLDVLRVVEVRELRQQQDPSHMGDEIQGRPAVAGLRQPPHKALGPGRALLNRTIPSSMKHGLASLLAMAARLTAATCDSEMIFDNEFCRLGLVDNTCK
jgi:hypothetical protein